MPGSQGQFAGVVSCRFECEKTFEWTMEGAERVDPMGDGSGDGGMETKLAVLHVGRHL